MVCIDSDVALTLKQQQEESSKRGKGTTKITIFMTNITVANSNGSRKSSATALSGRSLLPLSNNNKS